MKWYQIKIKVSDNNLNKNVQWYDLLKCNYYNNMGQISFIYLPAAFLKMKYMLPLDLGDEKQYLIDFNKIKVNGITINEYFNECIKEKKKVQYNILVKYCRFLYRTKTGLKDDFDKEIDQALIQFKEEFKNFCLFIVGNKLDIADLSERNLEKLCEIFKSFILFRSIKTGGLSDNYTGTLSDEKLLFRLQNFLSLDKDNATVAAFDGIFDDDRAIYIKQLYALLWCNSNLCNEELFFLFDCIRLIDYHKDVLVYRDIDFILRDIKNSFIIKTDDKVLIADNKSEEDFIKGFIAKFKYSIICKENEVYRFCLYTYFISNKHMSTFTYCILNLYIINKLKQIKWKHFINEALKHAVVADLSKEKLSVIADITSQCHIECLETQEVLTKVFSLEKLQLKMLLDFIYPNDNRRNIEKKREIKRTFPAILKAYQHYLIKKRMFFPDVACNHLYNIWIFLWLFYNIKAVETQQSLAVKGLKYTDSGLKRKNINKLQMKTMKAYIQKKETPASLEILTDIFIRYELLLNTKNLDINTVIYKKYFNKISSRIQKLLQCYLLITLKNINSIYKV